MDTEYLNSGLSVNKTKKDKFGFHTDFKRQLVKSNRKTTKINYKKILLVSLVSIFLITFLLITGLSGYIAWNSFTADPKLLKISKTSIAILFSPIYLFYIFLKYIIFKLPK